MKVVSHDVLSSNEIKNNFPSSPYIKSKPKSPFFQSKQKKKKKPLKS